MCRVSLNVETLGRLAKRAKRPDLTGATVYLRRLDLSCRSFRYNGTVHHASGYDRGLNATCLLANGHSSWVKPLLPACICWLSPPFTSAFEPPISAYSTLSFDDTFASAFSSSCTSTYSHNLCAYKRSPSPPLPRSSSRLFPFLVSQAAMLRKHIQSHTRLHLRASSVRGSHTHLFDTPCH
jgi:hypothetical protein